MILSLSPLASKSKLPTDKEEEKEEKEEDRSFFDKVTPLTKKQKLHLFPFSVIPPVGTFA
jgi:hypothetical protein